MTLEEKIKILCVRTKTNMSELARRTDQTPQNFSGKLKRKSFSLTELDEIAKSVDCEFEINFILPNGERI
ncbi:MAG: XRE family transcriptional regulator [Clostridiales bacterium 43-6]|mgnify:CR=1 FL=1|nr:MAG: XRE family transcriptional regulator [Clostridiales bacterium 43-6]